MTAMVAGAAAGREVELDDDQCISTSFPHFNQLLANARQ
jgi:5-enolpyruvylshikimate-3-phosphate synthase